MWTDADFFKKSLLNIFFNIFTGFSFLYVYLQLTKMIFCFLKEIYLDSCGVDGDLLNTTLPFTSFSLIVKLILFRREKW